MAETGLKTAVARLAERPVELPCSFYAALDIGGITVMVDFTSRVADCRTILRAA